MCIDPFLLYMNRLKIVIATIALSAVATLCTVFSFGCSRVAEFEIHDGVAVDIPSLVPAAQSVELLGGVCRLNGAARVAVEQEQLKPIARYLSEHLSLALSDDNSGAIALAVDERLGDEEYRLTIDQGGISITGGGYGGVFYGVTTLLQLMPQQVYTHSVTYPVDVPMCVISDRPRYDYRGFMLDVCRTWMTKESVMEYIDLLAYHKINTLRLHLTDDEAWRIEIESHPELAAEGGFRGGDAKIWPRYGKWDERWGGYYTKGDMCEIIEYARVRNMEVIPEIDLPGHSLCIATLHPEILCDYEKDRSRAFGYDTRSAFCASRPENYLLLDDILREVCELFPSQYIHVGGDEVDMSQWQQCPRCKALMQERGMQNTSELQQYFMSHLVDILAKYNKLPAVWNEAIEGGRLSHQTRVYGWEGVAECRNSAKEGYSTVVMPGQYFYFDMKQSPREPGHDWAAIFDWSKVYMFSPSAVGFSSAEQRSILGLEASFFSELYASHAPERSDYLHYQTFPRMVAFAEVAWVDSDERDSEAFYRCMVAHYDRLDAMGVAYRLMSPVVRYEDGMLHAYSDDGSDIYYVIDGENVEIRYDKPIRSSTPALYSFVSRRGRAISPSSALSAHFKTITPKFDITSSMDDSERFSFDKAEGYGRLARTTRAAGVGDWVMFTFESPVACRRMVVATGNFQLPRYIFESGYVEVSYDGTTFETVGELECGKYTIYPKSPIRAVRMVCTSQGNGAEWVSIQPPTIYPIL